VTQYLMPIVMTLVALKAGAKHELLSNKPISDLCPRLYLLANIRLGPEASKSDKHPSLILTNVNYAKEVL
jgi:hypothetical protein